MIVNKTKLKFYVETCINPFIKNKFYSKKIIYQKVNIWEQIKIIINSKTLSIKQKQDKLNLLKNFHIPSLTREWHLEEGPLKQILSILFELYPFLSDDIKDKVKISKDLKLPSETFTSKIINLELYFIIISLKNQYTIPHNAFILHLTLVMSSLVKFYHKEINEFENMWKLDVNLNRIDVSKFDKIERACWRIVIALIDVLIHHGLLKQSYEMVSSLENNQTNYRKENIKKNKWKIKTLSLDLQIRNKVDPLLMLFFDRWPQITIPKMFKEDNKHHSQLSGGFSSLSLHKIGRQSIAIASKTFMFYNNELYKYVKLTAEDEIFTLLNNFNKDSLENELDILRPKIREIRVVKNNFTRIEKLSSIYSFFEGQEELLYKWIFALCPKKRGKNEWSIWLDSMSNAPEKFVTILVQDILRYLIQYFNTIPNNTDFSIREEFNSYLNEYKDISSNIINYIFLLKESNSELNPNIETDCDLPFNFLDYFKDFDGDQVINHIKYIEPTINIISKIGIYKLTNLPLVGKLCSQKFKNIFNLWATKVFRNSYSNNYTTEILERFESIERRYLEKLKQYGMYISGHFKEKLMDLYKGIPFYLQPKIGVNGRFVYEGYSAHPHTGKLFRFVETKKELVDLIGLKYLKVAWSCSLGNKFKTFEDHSIWMENNKDSDFVVISRKISSIIYKLAYENSIQNTPTGTMIRVDQRASALTYWGLLTDCEVLKKATNIGVSKDEVDAYVFFGINYLTPLLDKIKENWEAKISDIKNNDMKQTWIYILNKVLIPGSKDRSLLKSLVMPHAYGLTPEGIGNILMNFIWEKLTDNELNSFRLDPLRQDSWFNYLELKIWHCLNSISTPRRKLQSIIEQTYKFIQQKDSKSFSTKVGFSDLKIEWDYKQKDIVKKTRWNKELQYSESIYVHQFSNRNDTSQNIRSFLPLLVHSIDGAVIRSVLRICSIEFGFTPITIHDCAMCHPNYVEKLFIALKRSIFEILGSNELTNKAFLENIWLNITMSSFSKEDRKEVIDFWNELWRKNGDTLVIIQADLIFRSPYNFSFE